MASINDKLRKYKSLFSTTLSTGIGTGTSDTITPATVTGLPTDTAITLTIDRVDSSGTATPSKLERIKGIISGGNLIDYVRGVDGTTEQSHTAGAVVEMVWNAADLNDIVDWGLVEHSQLGVHDKTKVVDLTTAQTLTNKTLTSPLFQGNVDGWVSANETWEYVSVDDPTGIFRVNADVTTKYSAGMRIKFTNGGNVIYGIITVVGSYSGGYTSITFLHQIDPTDSLALYLMANSAITANYYSTQKAPYGFPLESNKWTIIITSTSTNYQISPSVGTWYNISSINITIPIGAWSVDYIITIYGEKSGGGDTNIKLTLSTANNSESSVLNSIAFRAYASNFIMSTLSKRIFITLASKTIYYINITPLTASLTSIGLQGSEGGTHIIRAVCAYL